MKGEKEGEEREGGKDREKEGRTKERRGGESRGRREETKCRSWEVRHIFLGEKLSDSSVISFSFNPF